MTRKIRPVWRLALLAGLVLGGAAACERELTSVPGGAVMAETVGSGAIAGRVLDVSGVPVPGARVSTPEGASAVTGAGGEFVLAGLPAAERLAATVTAEGYASTTAIYRVVPGATLSREIRVLRRGPRVRIDAAAGGVVAFAGGGRVTIPPNAFAGVKPGESVTVQVTYYDPAAEGQLAAAPGDFSATEADGTASQLETAGMVDVFVTNAQNAQVSVAPGQQVQISFPDRDGGAVATWGLYRFDTSTGTWVRTGDAPPAPDGTQQARVPSVDRPWNADQPLITTCITVKVEDLGGAPRANELVEVEGTNWRASGWTDSSGSVDIRVKSSSQADVSAGPAAQTITTPSASQNCTPSVTLAY
ncbi:MAG TPA: carboxypeptidase-like regulatory domain-containing protein [Longimicrobium sp.]|jgi:hypothetical protein